MALDGDRLGDKILAALDALGGNAAAIPPALQTRRRAAFRAIGREIVAEFKDYARVTVEAVVATGIPVSTTGTAAAQAGQTTAEGEASTTEGTIR